MTDLQRLKSCFGELVTATTSNHQDGLAVIQFNQCAISIAYWVIFDYMFHYYFVQSIYIFQLKNLGYVINVSVIHPIGLEDKALSVLLPSILQILLAILFFGVIDLLDWFRLSWLSLFLSKMV